MSTANEIYEKAFAGPRDPRSEQYKEGVIATLLYLFGETKEVGNPYPAGTCSCDAFLAGTEEGWRRWKIWKEEKEQAQ